MLYSCLPDSSALTIDHSLFALPLHRHHHHLNGLKDSTRPPTPIFFICTYEPVPELCELPILNSRSLIVPCVYSFVVMPFLFIRFDDSLLFFEFSVDARRSSLVYPDSLSFFCIVPARFSVLSSSRFRFPSFLDCVSVRCLAHCSTIHSYIIVISIFAPIPLLSFSLHSLLHFPSTLSSTLSCPHSPPLPLSSASVLGYRFPRNDSSIIRVPIFSSDSMPCCLVGAYTNPLPLLSE